MSDLAVGSGRAVRSNPQYRLRRWESLSAMARNGLSSTGACAEGDAVLEGRAGSDLPAKLLNGAAARLFTFLRRPSPAVEGLPKHQLLELVLDGVLEVEVDSGWVGGPLAYEVLFAEVPLPDATDRLGRMSYDAVRWTGGLPASGAGALVSRLYGFGRVPLSQRWVRTYPGYSSVLELLDPDRLRRDWHVGPASTVRLDWLTFRRRGRPVLTAAELPYKLYVSPHPGELAEALAAVGRAVTETPAVVFKIGPHAAGLLRPDKMVIYLRDAEELVQTARTLAEVLAGARPHGVPFSAELAGEGILSWGGDPSPGAAPVGDRAESWRLSVCRRLGGWLTAAKRAPLQRLTPEDFALGRLTLDGVLLPSFAPSSVAEVGWQAPSRQGSS